MCMHLTQNKMSLSSTRLSARLLSEITDRSHTSQHPVFIMLLHLAAAWRRSCLYDRRRVVSFVLLTARDDGSEEHAAHPYL